MVICCKQKKTIGIPQKIYFNDKVASDPQSICELFSDYFGSVFEPNDTSVLAHLDCSLDSYNIKSINETEIAQRLVGLDARKGAGPDGIPAIFLK